VASTHNQRRCARVGLRSPLLSCLALFLPIMAVRSASSQPSVNATSHTIALVSEEAPTIDASDLRSRATLYQFLELSSTDVGVEGLEVDLSGVAGVDLADRRFNGIDDDPRASGDLIVGLLRWQDAKRRVAISLGRQYLFVGSGRVEHLDGLSLRYRTPWNIDVSAFGGRTRPWQLDYDRPLDQLHVSQEPFGLSNYALGGQLRFRLLERAIASAGFIHVGNGGDTVRQNFTFQLGYWDWSGVEAVAGGTIDTAVGRPQDLFLMLTSRPLSKLKLTADYSYQIPSLTIPKTSIFSVFTLDDYHSARAAAYYALTDHFWVSADGGLRLYEAADGLDVGSSAALALRYALGIANKGSIGLRGEWVDSADTYALNGRLYGAYRFDLGIYSTAELFVLHVGANNAERGSDYERRIAETPVSIGGRALAGYAFSGGRLAGVSLQLAGSYFVTPLAEHDLRLIARLSYRGRWSWGQ
jgi:hypothetical protein